MPLNKEIEPNRKCRRKFFKELKNQVKKEKNAVEY